jgi:hypothetical protein
MHASVNIDLIFICDKARRVDSLVQVCWRAAWVSSKLINAQPSTLHLLSYHNGCRLARRGMWRQVSATSSSSGSTGGAEAEAEKYGFRSSKLCLREHAVVKSLVTSLSEATSAFMLSPEGCAAAAMLAATREPTTFTTVQSAGSPSELSCLRAGRRRARPPCRDILVSVSLRYQHYCVNRIQSNYKSQVLLRYPHVNTILDK